MPGSGVGDPAPLGLTDLSSLRPRMQSQSRAPEANSETADPLALSPSGSRQRFCGSGVTGGWARRGLGHPEENRGTAPQSPPCARPVSRLLVDRMAFELKFPFPAHTHGCGKGARSTNTC